MQHITNCYSIIFDFDYTLAYNKISTDKKVLSILNHYRTKNNLKVLQNVPQVGSEYLLCKEFIGGKNFEKAYAEILTLNLQTVTTIEYSPLIAPLLNNLAKDYMLFIVSSRDSISLKHSLALQKLNHLFVEIIGTDNKCFPKKDLGFINSFHNKYRLSSNQCVYIGDKESDLQFAKLAKYHFIGASWYRDKLSDIYPNVCFSPTALTEMINNMLKAVELNYKFKK